MSQHVRNPPSQFAKSVGLLAGPGQDEMMLLCGLQRWREAARLRLVDALKITGRQCPETDRVILRLSAAGGGGLAIGGKRHVCTQGWSQKLFTAVSPLRTATQTLVRI